MRGLDDRRVVGEAEVVVAAEAEQLAAALDVDVGALRRRDRKLALVEAGFPDLRERLNELVLQRSVHKAS